MFKLFRSSSAFVCLALMGASAAGGVAAVARETASRCGIASGNYGRTTHRPSWPTSSSLPDAVGVLVTIDGVRYQDVFLGADDSLLPAADGRRGAASDRLVPNLHRIVRERGAAVGAPGYGAPIRAAGPAFLSLPGYHEILTGRAPSSCLDNRCPPVSEPTLLDELAAARDDGFAIAAVASWEGIARAAASRSDRVVLSAGRRGLMSCGPLQKDALLHELYRAGSRAASAPGNGNYRPDQHTATLGLELLRGRYARFLFLGLGDTDEHAHRGNYAGYLDALGFADSIVGQIDAELQSLELQGVSTLLVVTTDHGRGRGFAAHGYDPASARVWLVAAGSLVHARGPIHATEPMALADIAPTFRHFFGLPADGSPKAGKVLFELLRRYDPPRLRRIN